VSSVLGSGFLLSRFLLPFKDAGPILTLFLVKLVFPFGSRFFAVLAVMAALVAAGTVATLYVIVKLALRFRCNFIPVYDGFEVRALETIRELRGLFMVRAAREMGFVDGFVRGFGRGLLLLFLMVFLGCLISFLLDRLSVGQVKEVSDGGLYAPEVGWVGAGINGFLELVQSVTVFARPFLFLQVITDGRAVLKNGGFLGRHLADEDFQVEGFRKGNGCAELGIFQQGFAGEDLRDP
jgi:hypothetical protein